MKHVLIILLCLSYFTAHAQQRLAFTHITTDDGSGLASNVVSSIYQDEKGFIWIGTANGLQRFDGSKFISFSSKPGTAPLPHSAVSQIIPLDSNRLLLVMASIREFGIFDPSDFSYKKIPLKTYGAIPARAQFWVWKGSNGQIYLNILRYGILHFEKRENVFADHNPFALPAGWMASLAGVYEDVAKQQFWITCDSGLCIYDKASRQTWSVKNNPKNLALFNNKKLQEAVTNIYIDKERRIWAFTWPKGSGQQKYCFDSTGTVLLANDTLGLLTGPAGYTEYLHFYEAKKSGLWIYGLGVLFNWDKTSKSFHFNKSDGQHDNYGIDYSSVSQLMEDKDGSLWIATDRGLYFTSVNNDNLLTINLVFGNKNENTSITDILEMPNGDFWFTSWGTGIKSVDKDFKTIPNAVYAQKPPAGWPAVLQGDTKLTWTMCRETATGNIWIGCNEAVLLVHDPLKKTTRYLQPAEFNKSTIRYIAEDKQGQLWFGTQAGRLIRYSNNSFTVVQDLGTIIYKVFIDRQGWIWLATHERGLYAVDPVSGKLLQHYTSESVTNRLYSNTGGDIEQLNDSIIVFGAGALNFINKKNGTVHLTGYEEGLPSNSVERLRMDQTGFLWIITSNGLCRYNPNNNRITTFGRKDGIIMAEQTNAADYACSNGYIMFGGGNAVVMFHPSVFSNNQPPPNVSITDFKIFNKYFPLDSLMQLPVVKLQYDQNSFSIYFSALSYMQRDKLTYYYKMEGIDRNWIKADRRYYENYSLLPPGKYVFKVYCENLEGMRSSETTEIHIYIKPPFWRTWWFRSTILFLIALIAYDIHNARIKRLMAVEKLRNRVARDLHDDMGSTLSTINILSAMAKTKMNSDPVKTTEYLGKITDNSQRMMEAMDDIVWSIKPSNDSMQKITARMREFATSVLEAKEIDLDFTVDEKVYDIKLGMEARRDFFLVFKEAVNNAAKYSKASTVSIHVGIQYKKLVLSVKDNGSGFDVAAADGGNGLGNMRKRADAMNGSVRVTSDAGKGTEVTVSIPFS